MKVQSKLCVDCPWRPKTIYNNKEILNKLSDIKKIHICHNTYLSNKRCRGSYLWRKKQFKNGAIRLKGESYITKG